MIAALIARVLARVQPDGDPKLVIRPPRARYSGFDPQLRDRTRAKRRREEEIRRQADRVASSPEVVAEPRRLKAVGR